MAIDRRVQRTRTALYDALVRLIRQRPYGAITVEDILVEADVGRSTFYAHFTSKDDLLERSLERLKALLREAVGRQEGGGPASLRDCSRALFAHVAEYRDVHEALAGDHGSEVLHRALGKVLADVLREVLPRRLDPDLPRELAVQFMVATFATVLQWWFSRHPGEPPEAAESLYLRLIGSGLEGAWEGFGGVRHG